MRLSIGLSNLQTDGRPAMTVEDAKRDLPSDVKDAVHANRKIDAIKLLREQWNLDLKDAKEVVDSYIDDNRDLFGDQRPGRESAIGRLLIIIVLGCAIYFAYRSLS